MGWDAVVERFVKRSPLTVMAHITLRRALAATWLDAVFAQHAQRQYVRSLLFSTVVDLMASVTFGFRPSIHAAVKALGDTLPVSLTALYDKINRTEPMLVRALVREGAQRLAGVLSALAEARGAGVAGYAVRIVDGNHLPATEKRLKALRGLRGAALPGHTLVVYDPELALAVDIVPCEDAHAQERSLTAALLESAEAGQLWVADRNFSTTRLFEGLADKGVVFLVRKHGRSPTVVERGKPRRVGQTATGTVREQRVAIMRTDGGELPVRQVCVHLCKPTRDGDTQLVLLTNVPTERMTGVEIAEQYRRRWTIEGMFGELEAALAGELRTLGQPRAALFAFGLAVLAFNVLQVVRRAVETAHTVHGEAPQVSSYLVAVEIRATYQGFAIAVDGADWTTWEAMEDTRFAATLRKMAAGMNIESVRKSKRGPKKRVAKGYLARNIAQRHHSTARLVAAARSRKAP